MSVERPILALMMPVSIAALLGGCATTEPASPPVKDFSNMSQQELCIEAHEMLGSPWLSDWEKAALFETMRNKGCMG